MNKHIGSVGIGTRKSIALNVLFEPRDMWVGLFWRHERPAGYIVETWELYICLLPMLPILVTIERVAQP